MKSEEIADGLKCKGTINKEVLYIFNFAFAETAPVGSIPTLLNKIIPGIDFIFNNQPNETFYFLRNVKVPQLRVDIVMGKRQNG